MALRKYFKDGVDLYYSAPTGHGKSLVFQAIRVIADVLAHFPPLTSNVLEESVLKDIEDGAVYSVIYASPESLLSDSSRWRKILSSSGLPNFCVGVAIDEAHCIHQWVFSSSQKKPFREWFGLLGEIRSLLPNGVQMSVFTPTATTLTRDKIFDVLNLNKMTTFVLEKLPLKENLRFSVEYVANNMPFHEIFAPLLENLKKLNSQTERITSCKAWQLIAGLSGFLCQLLLLAREWTARE
eukprot:gene13232-14590_t